LDDEDERLEAPPGFEPGVEVLQPDQNAFFLSKFAVLLNVLVTSLGPGWMEMLRFGLSRCENGVSDYPRDRLGGIGIAARGR
jgi:hypothetical protein